MNEKYQYAGGELALFAKAIHWKKYVSRVIGPYIAGDVLEVGAGIGESTRLLHAWDHRSWLCVEPDSGLFQELRKTVSDLPDNHTVTCMQGFLADLGTKQLFDTILYIDVLEHIEKDASEMEAVSRYLRPGGHVIILAPAHQCLFTPFDAAIGHFRRYGKSSLQRIIPENIRILRMIYLDSVGLAASLANRFLLKQAMPTLGQIMTWDRMLVPVSRIIDPLFRYRLGKTIVGVGKKTV
ncbi:MAG: class I SAM-dependent methyltransferase [Thermodesulfobacteriota bacterium]